MRKRAAKARSPCTSQSAIAVSIFALISAEADGLRPIACIAPYPISPIPRPEPITPRRAKGRFSIIKKDKNKRDEREKIERDAEPSDQYFILKITKKQCFFLTSSYACESSGSDSFRYRDESVIKMYAWRNATRSSKNQNGSARKLKKFVPNDGIMPPM